MFICHTYIYIYVAAYIQNLFWQKQCRNIYNVFLAAKKPRKNRKHRIQIRHTNKKQFGPGESSHDPPSPHLKTAALRPPPGSAQSCMCSRCLVSFWPYQAMTLTSVRILWQSSPCKLKFKNSSIYLVCYRHRSTIYIYICIYGYKISAYKKSLESYQHLWGFGSFTSMASLRKIEMLIHGGFRIKPREVASQLAPEDGILHHNLHYLDPCVHYLGLSFWPKKIVYHLYGQTMVDKTVDRKLLGRAVFVSDYSMRLRWRCVEKVLALWVPSFGIVETWTFRNLLEKN